MCIGQLKGSWNALTSFSIAAHRFIRDAVSPGAVIARREGPALRTRYFSSDGHISLRGLWASISSCSSLGPGAMHRSDSRMQFFLSIKLASRYKELMRRITGKAAMGRAWVVPGWETPGVYQVLRYFTAYFILGNGHFAI